MVIFSWEVFLAVTWGNCPTLHLFPVSQGYSLVVPSGQFLKTFVFINLAIFLVAYGRRTITVKINPS